MPRASTQPAREEKIKSRDGLSLFVRSWRPDGQARSVVAIVPGFNSHSGYYSWVGDQLAANGFAENNRSEQVAVAPLVPRRKFLRLRVSLDDDVASVGAGYDEKAR